MTTVIFSHGQESGPWGTKIRAMAGLVKGLGLVADSIDYQGIADPTERVAKCVRECAGIDDDIVLVGSSMGGHVATAAAGKVGASGLFVLAPAYFMAGYEDLTPPDATTSVFADHGAMAFPGIVGTTMDLLTWVKEDRYLDQSEEDFQRYHARMIRERDDGDTR